MDTTESSDKKPQLSSANITAGPNTQQQALTAVEHHLEILPVIYEIIRGYVLLAIFLAEAHSTTIKILYSIEKDPTDNAAKQRESQDCSQKVRVTLI